MSLKTFHIFFITLSALLSVFLITWGLREYRQSRDLISLLIGGSGLLLLILLIPYGRWFLNKIKRLPALLIAANLWGFSRSAEACSVCYGDPNSLLTKGAKSGVLFLLLVIVGILAAILGIGIAWARRALRISVLDTSGIGDRGPLGKTISDTALRISEKPFQEFL